MSVIKFNKEEFCDVLLKVTSTTNDKFEYKEYRANKSILSNASEVFYKMFTNPLGSKNISKDLLANRMDDSSKDFANIAIETSLENFELFCGFLYSSDKATEPKDLDSEMEIISLLAEYMCKDRLETRLKMIYSSTTICMDAYATGDGKKKLLFSSDLLSMLSSFYPETFEVLQGLIERSLKYCGPTMDVINRMLYYSPEMVDLIVQRDLYLDGPRGSLRLVCALYDRAFLKSDTPDFREFAKHIGTIRLTGKYIRQFGKYINMKPKDMNPRDLELYREKLLANIFEGVECERTSGFNDWCFDLIEFGLIKDKYISYTITKTKKEYLVKVDIEIPVEKKPDILGDVSALNVIVTKNSESIYIDISPMPILRTSGDVAKCNFKFNIPFEKYMASDGKYGISLFMYQGYTINPRSFKIFIDEDQFTNAIEIPEKVEIKTEEIENKPEEMKSKSEVELDVGVKEIESLLQKRKAEDEELEEGRKRIKLSKEEEERSDKKKNTIVIRIKGPTKDGSPK